MFLCVCLQCPPPKTSALSLDVNAEQANLAIVAPLLSGINILYFIYQKACRVCSLPPPVSDALSMPLNAKETLAPHVIEQRDVSSKYVQQMSLISRDLI